MIFYCHLKILFFEFISSCDLIYFSINIQLKA